MAYAMWTEHKTLEEIREFDAMLLGVPYEPPPVEAAPEPKSENVGALMAAFSLPQKG